MELHFQIFGAKLSDITTEDATIPPAIAGLMHEIEKNGKKYLPFISACLLRESGQSDCLFN